MKKVVTDCCALCQIAKVSNDTPKELLAKTLDILNTQMLNNREVGITTGNGQTATFTVVSPGENKLEQNLIDLGYEHVWTFPRRVGYPNGNLKLYIKNV